MSQYLKRIDILSVEEMGVDTTGSQFLKVVDVVEVYDQDGQPWEPVPGPDPWEELAIVDIPLLHESNIYEIGETIYATTATYTGGTVDETIYRWRWQVRENDSANWVNTPWNSYDNELTQASYELTAGGQVKFQCQAKDSSEEHPAQKNAFTSLKTVPYPALSATTPTATGLPYVGETLTCSTPTVTGGLTPYQLDYFWVDESNAIIWETPYMGQSTTVVDYDLGKNMKALVMVTSADNQSITVESNSIGPIEEYSMGELSVVNATQSNAPVENGEVENIINGATVIYAGSISGNLPSSRQQWVWNVRSGGAHIVGPNDQDSVKIQLPSEYPGAVQMSCGVQTATQVSDDPTQSLAWTINLTE
tara:strand:- start:273 stop:1361 length:1089 start_codon:yes stop_codon:yes gene_type:complete